MEINDILLNLAREQARLNPQIDALKIAKNESEMALKAAQNELEKADAVARESIMYYIKDTGDVTPHPLVTFRRKTKLMYDKDIIAHDLMDREIDEDKTWSKNDVLVMLRSGQLGKYLDIEVALHVRQFEKDVKTDELNWCDVETVPAPEIAIGKLGSLLIEAGEA